MLFLLWSVTRPLQVLAKTIDHPFSVAADKQILFSSGNLQYNAAQGSHLCADGSTHPGTWRFAEHQYDIAGEPESVNDWIDLFGWGTSGWNSGANAYQPWSVSTSNDDYYPGGEAGNSLIGDYAYADWGQYNTIGEDTAGTWRTLTSEEWIYLFKTRTNAANKYGAAKVNGMAGVVILPDEWMLPNGCACTAGMTSASNSKDWSYVAATNDYTVAQWQLMEANGAIFLPCAGSRLNIWSNIGTYGYYWSSTTNGDERVYGLRLHSNQQSVVPHNRCGGRSVRLVKDYTPPPPPVCTDVETEFSDSIHEGESYLWEDTEYTTAGDYTHIYPIAEECDSTVTLHLTVLPPECLGNYDTVRFCTGLNTEHDEIVRHGYCIRYLPYRYEPPTDWDYMEGVILVRESDRTLMDLTRAERNLRAHYIEDLTPVQSVYWSWCKIGEHEYHPVTVENGAQWIEAGTLALSVYFLCGQKFYTDFTTDIDNLVAPDKQHSSASKILLDGHIYILRGNYIYDLRGQRVR